MRWAMTRATVQLAAGISRFSPLRPTRTTTAAGLVGGGTAESLPGAGVGDDTVLMAPETSLLGLGVRPGLVFVAPAGLLCCSWSGDYAPRTRMHIVRSCSIFVFADGLLALRADGRGIHDIGAAARAAVPQHGHSRSPAASTRRARVIWSARSVAFLALDQIGEDAHSLLAQNRPLTLFHVCQPGRAAKSSGIVAPPRTAPADFPARVYHVRRTLIRS